MNKKGLFEEFTLTQVLWIILILIGAAAIIYYTGWFKAWFT